MAEPLAPHPEVERLKTANALLRDEVARLLAEHDHLLQTVRPNLLALYQVKLGPWELRLLEEQCATARVRRLTEMVQASLSAGRLPDAVEISRKLDEEFALWQARLREAADKLQTAQRVLANPMSPAEDQEFKHLYRNLVKLLHPDVAKPDGGQAAMLWHRVQDAYARADLVRLRELWELASQLVAPTISPNSLDLLQEEAKALRSQVEHLGQGIAELQAKPPFDLLDKLEDEAWLETRRQEIETRITALQERRRALEAYLSIIPEVDCAKWLGAN